MNRKLIIALVLLLSLKTSFALDLVGVVKDKSNNELLPYATIAQLDGKAGVITDENGEFRFEIEKISDKDTLVISYLGYNTLKRTTKEIAKNPECLLEVYTFEIAVVEITPLDIENILRKTHDKFYDNHVHKNIATQGYYREQFFEDNECVRFGEVVFDTRFYEEDGEDVSVVAPHLARSIEDSSFLKRFNSVFNSRKMIIPFGIDNYFDNGVAESIKVEEFHKFMGKFFFDKKNDGFKIDYKLSENYKLNGRENYFIRFDVTKRNTAIATGHFLIDNDNYGIAGFEIKLNQQEDLTKLLIPPRFRLILKLLGYSIDIDNYEAKLSNRYKNGKWYIGTGVQIIQLGIAKKGQWFRGKAVNEFHSFNSSKYKAVDKEKNEFKDQRLNDFSSAFWGTHPFSPIQPKQQEYIQKIIAKNNLFSGNVLSEKTKKNIAKKKAKKKKK